MTTTAQPTATTAGIRPLAARSVILSLMLGAHPRGLSPSALTRAGEHFAIAPSTLRVALTRAVAAGDLQRAEGEYVLGTRLQDRQRRQDEAGEAADRPWDGTWELAVVTVAGRPGPERAALRETLNAARMAELREGIWMRPANLRRAPPYAAQRVLTCFRTQPHDDPAALASTLWNLTDWTRRGHDLIAHLHSTHEPPARLATAAHLVRHLATDPLLPKELLPTTWPGNALRAAYAAYQDELRDLATAQNVAF